MDAKTTKTEGSGRDTVETQFSTKEELSEYQNATAVETIFRPLTLVD